jgi:hypothetical protein
MTVEVNMIAVVLAALSSMVVGAIWYSKGVFGKTWFKLVGMTDEKATKGAAKAMSLTLVVSFITAYVLAHVTYLAHDFFGNSFLSDALQTAFWTWLGFTAARFVTHDAFEQRPAKLTVMNLAHELVTLLVMAAIIGQMGV